MGSFCNSPKNTRVNTPIVWRDPLIPCAIVDFHVADPRQTQSQMSIRCRNICLICASFGVIDSENTDSARCCRFRKSRQKRASDLDLTYVWIPKLDVAGSSPVSRSKINNLEVSQKQTLHSPPL